MTLVAAAAGAGGVTGGAAAAPTGATVSAPPPYPAQPVPAVDGPVVADADPFTLTAPGLAPGQVEVTTVSTRPSLVSGPAVRVRVRGLSAGDTARILLDGRDAGVLPPDPTSSPGSRDGLVGGLVTGAHTITAVVAGAGGTRTASLAVVDHPLDGPVVSGAHQEPFVCETVASGMGAPTTPDCDAPTQDHWYARNAVTGQFSQLSDPYAPYPPGTATTTVDGRTVPFVVRIESSVVNRSVTRVAVLDDPHARGPQRPFSPEEWNRRLLYLFGESCGTGYDQGVVHEKDVLGDPQGLQENYILPVVSDIPGHLGQGYMVALSSLTTLGVHCNQLLSAETMMMVKEHIVDDYGLMTHTIGVGGSGGAIQQQVISNLYPGLLDAATVTVSFPDVYTPFTTVLDCHLLDRVFAADPTRWTAAKQVAVTGLATPQTCKDWDTGFMPLFDPTNCPAGIPPADRYNATGNPHGVRCDIQEGMRVVWGVDPATGFAYRPLDNVGVQYGLGALRSGMITPDDFVTLNRAAGGIDMDAGWTPQRTAMQSFDATIAFASGEEDGRGAVDEVPIIDQSVPALDYAPSLDIHDQLRPFEMRARLDATYGSHANQAIWSGAPYPANAIDVAQEWLTALDGLQASQPGLSRAALVARSRPADAADQCRTVLTGVPGPCDQGVLRHSDTRLVAGGPLTQDVLQCHVRPVDARDYPAAMTAAQVDQVRAVFPGGVCDYSQQSVGAVPRSQPWLSWGDGEPGTTPVTVPYPAARSAAGGSAGVAALAAGPAADALLPDTGGPGAGAAALVAAGAPLVAVAARRRRRGAMRRSGRAARRVPPGR